MELYKLNIDYINSIYKDESVTIRSHDAYLQWANGVFRTNGLATPADGLSLGAI